MDFAFPFSLAIAKLLASDYVAGRIQVRTEYESVKRILALFKNGGHFLSLDRPQEVIKLLRGFTNV